jgi:peroxiredoxin
MHRLTRVGDAMPEFALSDLDGRTWHRDELAGKPSVLFLFSSW